MKKINEKLANEKEIWSQIEWGIRLTKQRFPHISEIVLTESQKMTLINFYSKKKYVEYCAKFEEYFLINVSDNGQISKCINGVRTPDTKS